MEFYFFPDSKHILDIEGEARNLGAELCDFWIFVAKINAILDTVLLKV